MRTLGLPALVDMSSKALPSRLLVGESFVKFLDRHDVLQNVAKFTSLSESTVILVDNLLI